MSQCTKCETNFVGTPENPPVPGLCKYCESEIRRRKMADDFCRSETVADFEKRTNLKPSNVGAEAYRDRHGKKRECSICKGNGFLDVEKYDRVEQEDCKWCGTTGIEPQPPMP